MKKKLLFFKVFILLICIIFLLIFFITCEVPTKSSDDSGDSDSENVSKSLNNNGTGSVDPETQEFLGEIPPATVKLLSKSFYIAKYKASLEDTATLTPAELAATLEPGASITETKTLTLPSDIKPPKGDIMFALDLTGSMGQELSNVKNNSLNIMTELSTIIADTNYGVISHMDYNGYYDYAGYAATYGTGDDYPYSLDQALTSDSTVVGNIINSLSLGSGYDSPESYLRVLYESVHDSAIGWRTGSKKILLFWLDNQPHDVSLSTGVDPGRDAIAGTADDIELYTALQEMKDNNITLIVLYSGSYSSQFNNWKTWAESTGGDAFQISTNGTIPDGTDIATFIASIMSETVKNIEELTLEVTTSGYEGWLVSKTPEYYYDILLDTAKTLTFDIEIKVPETATDGLHPFIISAIGDGVQYASQQVNITVKSNNPPVADAGEDQIVEQSYYQGADVTLDGSGSSDPDGDALTYSWSWSGGSASGVNPVVSLPLGETVVTLTVSDPDGESSTDTVEIIVEDTTPPELTADFIKVKIESSGKYDKCQSCGKGKYIKYDSKSKKFKCDKCGHHGHHHGHHKVKFVYKIDYETSDICDASPVVTAFLRIEYKSHKKCIPISKGKIIEIEIDLDNFTDDSTSKWEKKILKILGCKYVELVIQSVDASGNMTEVVVEPPDFDRRHKDKKRHHFTYKRNKKHKKK